MSEQSVTRWLSFWMAGVWIVAITIGYFAGRKGGRAEQKRWDDAWYQAHPVVKEGSMDFPTPTGIWLHPAITFDTFGPGMEGKAWFSKDGSELYIQGIPPSPPKKAKPAPCLVGQEKNRAQDVCCPAYLEVNDCSWHHGTNPREASKP